MYVLFLSLLLVPLVSFSVQLAESRSRPLSVVVLYPLIDLAHRKAVDDLICNSNAHDALFSVLIPENAATQIISACVSVRPVPVLALSLPQEIKSIKSADDARIASLYQNAGSLTGIDVIAAKIALADVVMVGNLIYTPPYEFLLHVFDMIPNLPLVFSFSPLPDFYSVQHEAINSKLTYTLGTILEQEFQEMSAADKTISEMTLLLREKRSFRRSPSICYSASSDNEQNRCLWKRELVSVTGREFLSEADASSLLALSRSVRKHHPKAENQTRFSDCSQKGSEFELLGQEGSDVLRAMAPVSAEAHQLESGNSDNLGDSSVRLLCLMYTTHTNDPSRLQAVVDTWAWRCDGFLAFSDATDETLGAIDTAIVHAIIHRHENVTTWQESYDTMWPKAKLIWTAVVTSDLIDAYDFFLLGGDDMYVIPENMRHLLSSERISQIQGEHRTNPVYLGREIMANAYHRFHSGGSGYVLNQAAATTLFELMYAVRASSGDIIPSGCLPNVRCSMEDLMVGRCLREAGILPQHSRSDTDGLETFHPLPPQEMFSPHAADEWFRRMIVHAETGLKCCSSRSATFHYIKSAEMMRCMDSVLYGERRSSFINEHSCFDE